MTEAGSSSWDRFGARLGDMRASQELLGAQSLLSAPAEALSEQRLRESALRSRLRGDGAARHAALGSGSGGLRIAASIREMKAERDLKGLKFESLRLLESSWQTRAAQDMTSTAPQELLRQTV